MADEATRTTNENHEARFLKAFEEYSDALFRHAFLRISDRERAIDLVHDTFTKVWSYIRTGHEVTSFKSFLYKVLNNLIIDEYRKHKESSLDALFEVEGIDEGTFSELSADDTDSMIASLDGQRAFDLVHQLPDTYKEVLILRYVDELGPKEISELIEETENVISVRLHRGMKMLRDLVESEESKATSKRQTP
jgi:RNA polymerase sigma-70 factor, ECF subfamily